MWFSCCQLGIVFPLFSSLFSVVWAYSGNLDISQTLLIYLIFFCFFCFVSFREVLLRYLRIYKCNIHRFRHYLFTFSASFFFSLQVFFLVFIRDHCDIFLIFRIVEVRQHSERIIDLSSSFFPPRKVLSIKTKTNKKVVQKKHIVLKC